MSPRPRTIRFAAAALLSIGLSSGAALLGPSPASAAPPGDQCGSTGTEWVPDQGQGFDFRDPCRRHDLCYGSKPFGGSGAGRAACDAQFRRDAYESCAAQPGAPGGFGCADLADAYYWGIRIGGGDPFDRATPPTPIVTVGPVENVPLPTPTVTVGEPTPFEGGGGGGGGYGGGSGGGSGGGYGGSGGGSSSGGGTPTVTVGEPETVAE